MRSASAECVVRSWEGLFAVESCIVGGFCGGGRKQWTAVETLSIHAETQILRKDYGQDFSHASSSLLLYKRNQRKE